MVSTKFFAFLLIIAIFFSGPISAKSLSGISKNIYVNIKKSKNIKARINARLQRGLWKDKDCKNLRVLLKN